MMTIMMMVTMAGLLLLSSGRPPLPLQRRGCPSVKATQGHPPPPSRNSGASAALRLPRCRLHRFAGANGQALWSAVVTQLRPPRRVHCGRGLDRRRQRGLAQVHGDSRVGARVCRRLYPRSGTAHTLCLRGRGIWWRCGGVRPSTRVAGRQARRAAIEAAAIVVTAAPETTALSPARIRLIQQTRLRSPLRRRCVEGAGRWVGGTPATLGVWWRQVKRRRHTAAPGKQGRGAKQQGARVRRAVVRSPSQCKQQQQQQQQQQSRALQVETAVGREEKEGKEEATKKARL